MIGQIGTGKAAAAFLEGMGKNKDIADMVFVTSGKPQPALAALRGQPCRYLPTY
jgi:ribose 5-phosphate isomerase